MRNTRSSLAALLAVAPLGSTAAAPQALPDVIATREASRPSATKRITPQARAMWLGRHRNGPGWSVRQVQRMAKKRRNKLRNRKAHR